MGSTLQVVCCSKEKEEIDRETLIATDAINYSNIKTTPLQHIQYFDDTKHVPLYTNTDKQTQQPQTTQQSQTTQQQTAQQPQTSQQPQFSRNTSSHNTILGGQIGLGYY